MHSLLMLVSFVNMKRVTYFCHGVIDFILKNALHDMLTLF